MLKKSLILALLLCLSWPATGEAQNHKPGSCCRAPGFQVDNLPSPPLMTGIGNSHIPITTRSPKAQQYFDQGVRLMHAFWEFEAYRAFKEAARLDNQCAMAYWGMYIALPGSGSYQTKKQAMLDKAVALRDKASAQEQHYINAYEKLSKDDDESTANYNQEMEALIDHYPDDNDAKLFYAYSLLAGYKKNGQPRTGTIYAQTLIKNVLLKDPDSAAAHHYWIHAVESERPELGQDSAARLAQLAPNSGHLTHMPGHIYYRLGDYERAHTAFVASRQVDRDYMKAQRIEPVDDWNYIHNLDYLVANCAEDGRYQEGLQYAKEAQALSLDARCVEAMRDGAGRILYIGKPVAAKLMIRYGRWAESVEILTQLCQNKYVSSAYAQSYYQAFRAYTQGMAAVQAGQLTEAQGYAESLEAKLWQMTKQMTKPESAVDSEFSEIVDLLEISALELRGTILSEQNQPTEALQLLEKAVEKEQELDYREPPQYYRPVLESLASAYIRMHKYDKAIETYKQELVFRPNSGHALYGLAQALNLAGRKQQARQSYEKFLQAWQSADPDLPEVVAAKAWLAQTATK